MTEIFELCRGYTGLSDDDISVVVRLSRHLSFIADLTRADVFLDVMTKKQGAALVVAEANPTTASSLYTQTVIGQLALEQNEPAVLKSLKTGLPVWEVKGVSQEGRPIKQSVIPIKNQQAQVTAVLIMEQDISEQVKTEAKVELLSETAEKLTAALLDVSTVDEVLPTIIQDAVIITNLDYVVLYANHLASYILGMKSEVSTETVLTDPIKAVIDNTAQNIEETADLNFIGEIGINHHYYKYKYVPFKKNNQLVGHIILLRDITDLRNKEKELVVKAAVLKEINHRVKNNLHTVAGLLRLQMRRSASKEVKKALQTSVNRIASIGLIHEVLAVEDSRYIELLPLVEKVARLSIEANADTGSSIQVEISGDTVLLSSETATSTAMVLNELIQNSVEHGFYNTGTGKITIDIRKIEGPICITYTDNGLGIPSGFSLQENKGLGLTIVDSIVREKLEGEIHFTGVKGNTIKFVFPAS